MKVKIYVSAKHIRTALAMCANQYSIRSKNCALAEAINARLLPGMYSIVGPNEVTIYYAPGYHKPEPVASIPLPVEAIRMIEAFDAHNDRNRFALYSVPKPPQPGSFTLDLSI